MTRIRKVLALFLLPFAFTLVACGDDDGGDDAAEETTTTEEEDDEETTTTEEEDADEDDADDGGDVGNVEIGDAEEPPELGDPEAQDLADECFDGDMQACDDLITFAESPDDDVYEYSGTCGGRVDLDDALTDPDDPASLVPCTQLIGETAD
ncbi:MAG: hypothetical protein ACRD0G_19205 [Acidimicrobiales bacterium]